MFKLNFVAKYKIDIYEPIKKKLILNIFIQD